MTDKDDPFAPFKQFMESFGSQGIGSLGMPMSAVPGMGMGMGQMSAPMSPEAGTQASLKQLYSAIEELSRGSGTTPANFWQQYQDVFDMDASAWSPDRFWSYAMTTNQIWFHSLSQLLVEAYTLRLIHDELISDAYRHSTGTQEWLWTLSQPDREELLLRTLDIDEELVEEMRQARERRNELLYDIGSWGDLDFDTPMEDAQRYMRILDRLDELVADTAGFDYLPSEGENEKIAPESDGGESGGDEDVATEGEKETTDGDRGVDADDESA